MTLGFPSGSAADTKLDMTAALFTFQSKFPSQFFNSSKNFLWSFDKTTW